MNLETRYLGLNLKNPIVAAASPLTKRLDSAKRLEDAGVGALVMYSLFEEQITHERQELDHFLGFGTDSFAEALSYFPEPHHYYNRNAEDYLDHIADLKKSVQVPVIASLNGVSKGGWMDYAKKMQQAGADAIELNVFYVPTSASLSAQQVEEMYLDALKAVKAAVSIPVALKLGSWFSSFAHFARRLDAAGADGLVLFNRFFGPDIDLEKLEVVPKLELSKRVEMQVPLRWIAILYGNVKADLAGSSGIHEAEDVLKMIMAGASVAMLASVLLEKGERYVATLLSDIRRWMEQNDYESIGQMRGSMSYRSVAEPAAYERANYMKTLQSYV